MTDEKSDILTLVAQGDAAALGAALEGGADAGACGRWGVSALAQAAARGRLEVVERLLEAGADPGHKNKWGLGAADWAQWPDTTSEVRAVLLGGRD